MWKYEKKSERKAQQDLNLWPPNCETGVQTARALSPPHQNDTEMSYIR